MAPSSAPATSVYWCVGLGDPESGVCRYGKTSRKSLNSALGVITPSGV